MPQTPLPPEDCQNLEQVRAGVDALDAELVRLLARRFDYMRTAARIKPKREQVRDEARKAEVIANAEGLAKRLGSPPQALVTELWERLVESSIDYELEVWDALRRVD